MWSLIILAFSLFPSKDISYLAKQATVKLFKQQLAHDAPRKIVRAKLHARVLDYAAPHFLTQVTVDKKSFCFIIDVEEIDGKKYVSYVDNNNDVANNVYITKCDRYPDAKFLENFKSLNAWSK